MLCGRPEAGGHQDCAGLGPPAEHALISLLVLNGLRVSEATGADIEHMGLERGHRTLVITREGGNVVTIPLAPRTARAIDLATGERTEGPPFVTADGKRPDRHCAAQAGQGSWPGESVRCEWLALSCPASLGDCARSHSSFRRGGARP